MCCFFFLSCILNPWKYRSFSLSFHSQLPAHPVRKIHTHTHTCTVFPQCFRETQLSCGWVLSLLLLFFRDFFPLKKWCLVRRRKMSKKKKYCRGESVFRSGKDLREHFIPLIYTRVWREVKSCHLEKKHHLPMFAELTWKFKIHVSLPTEQSKGKRDPGCWGQPWVEKLHLICPPPTSQRLTCLGL